jgi:hypothetical protein
MGEDQIGMEAPVNVVDQIPEPHRTTFVSVLDDQDPELLRTLRASTVPAHAAWEAVQETFIDAMSEHWGPGHEPDETGKRIDNALGAFMARWPEEELGDSQTP